MFILLIVIHALLAATFTIGQAAVQVTQPIFFIAVRMVFGGSFLLGYLYFFKRQALSIKKTYSLLAQISLFHIYIPYVSEFWALQYIGSAKAALIYSLSPFITALFEYFLFSLRLTRRKLFGLLIGFIGFLPLLMTCDPKECSLHHFFFLSLPEVAMILSTISSCFGWILLKKAIIYKKHSSIFTNGVGMVGGGLLALVTSMLVEYWHPLPTTSVGNLFISAIALILLANVIYYNVYGWLMHKYSATFLSFSGIVIPLFAALYQWIFFKESVGSSFFITLAMVVIGLYMFYKDEFSA